MPDLGSTENIYLVLIFVVPGLVISFVRSQFVIGRPITQMDAVFGYIVITVLYYSVALPIFQFFVEGMEPGLAKTLAWVALIFVAPAVVGTVLGVNAQKGYVHRILLRMGLNPIHVIPTAWDWKFGNMVDHWVLVTLKNDVQFAGYCGRGSFMSSDPAERDIYVEKIYDLDDENRWIERPGKSILITAGEVRTIEFWPVLGAVQ